MKLNRQNLKDLIKETLQGIDQQIITEDLVNPSAYEDQTIVNADVFKDPAAILENVQKLTKAIDHCWNNDQNLQGQIKELQDQIKEVQKQLGIEARF
jgi:peptidoglycan hydrolase CwlO-like protein